MVPLDGIWNRDSIIKTFIIILSISSTSVIAFHEISPLLMKSGLQNWYKINQTQLDKFSISYLCGFFICQPVCGVLSDVISPAKILFYSSVVISLAQVMISFAHDYITGLIFRSIVGIGCSMFNIPFYRAISNWFSSQSQTIYVFLLSSIELFSILYSSGPILTYFQFYDWRKILWVLSGITAFIGIASLIFVVEPERLEIPDTHLLSASEIPTTADIVNKNLNICFLLPEFGKITGIIVISAFFEDFILYWIRIYINSISFYKFEFNGLILEFIPISLILFALSFGFLSEFFQKRKPFLICFSLNSLISIFPIASFGRKVPLPLFWLLIFLYGIFTDGNKALCRKIGMDIIGETGIGTAVGTLNFYFYLAKLLFHVYTNYFNMKLITKFDESIVFQYIVWIPMVLLTAMQLIISLFTKESYIRILKL